MLPKFRGYPCITGSGLARIKGLHTNIRFSIIFYVSLVGCTLAFESKVVGSNPEPQHLDVSIDRLKDIFARDNETVSFDLNPHKQKVIIIILFSTRLLFVFRSHPT